MSTKSDFINVIHPILTIRKTPDCSKGKIGKKNSK